MGLSQGIMIVVQIFKYLRKRGNGYGLRRRVDLFENAHTLLLLLCCYEHVFVHACRADVLAAF